jgi:hypothetical protein
MTASCFSEGQLDQSLAWSGFKNYDTIVFIFKKFTPVFIPVPVPNFRIKPK